LFKDVLSNIDQSLSNLILNAFVKSIKMMVSGLLSKDLLNYTASWLMAWDSGNRSKDGLLFYYQWLSWRVYIHDSTNLWSIVFAFRPIIFLVQNKTTINAFLKVEGIW